MARGPKRFTVFDMMEEKGIFEANPANPYARNIDNQSIYAGPVAYPKMLYHPKGEERIIVQATLEMTPLGPAWRGEQRELIWTIADDAKMEKELLDAGWHLHPSDAVRVAKGLEPEAKPTPPATLADLQAQNEALLAELARLKAELE